MHLSILRSIRQVKTLKKHFNANNFRCTSTRHAFSLATEYEDVLDRIPNTKFNYPEQKIHVPKNDKTILDVWKLEFQHYIDYIKNPSKEKRFIREVLPTNFDIIIIGGGFIGSSLGYWFRERYGDAQSILVIDKNLKLDRIINEANPQQFSAAMGIGNIRQQFSLEENVEMAQYSTQFFRQMSEILNLQAKNIDPVPYKPFGVLTLARKEQEELLKENHMLQRAKNVNNELLTSFQMNQRFPWLNTDDIKVGCHGLENEGWIDPRVYLLTMRNAAISIGTVFMEAEPAEFVHREARNFLMRGFEANDYKQTNEIILKLPDGSYKQITFGTCILALGADTGRFTKQLLHLDQNNPGLFGMEIPIERRKRYIFSFEAPEGGMELSSPLIVDPCGLFVQRTGVFDYICGMAPVPEEEPSTDNLDIDYDFFYQRIWPLMAKRIPALEHLRLKSGYAYFIDHNTYDGNGILGRIPAYDNIFLAAGFGENGLLFSPIIGKSLSDLLYDDHYSIIELYNLSYKRILKDIALHEGIKLQ